LFVFASSAGLLVMKKWILFSAAALAVVKSVAAPVIGTQPSPRTNSVSLGAIVSNRISASSNAGAVTYQWRHEGTNLPGKIAASISLTNVTVLDAGAYTAVATDANGTTESATWLLDVDTAFRKVTSSAAVAVGNSGGVAWGDLNQDGWPELVVMASSVNVFSNQFGTNLVKIASTYLDGLTFKGSATWADYDNDGWTDLLSVGYTGCALSRNVGGVLKATTGTGLGSGNLFGGAWADYDRDGFVDVFFTSGFNRTVNSLYRNTNGVFKLQKGSIASKDLAEYSQGPAWGDYDNDGWPDLFVANARDYNSGVGSPSFLYHNNQGVLEKVTNVITTNFFGLATGVWGDFNNDGRLDLFAAGYMVAGGPQRRLLFRNDGGGNFTRVLDAGSICTDAGYDQGTMAIDYDNDGWLDIFVTSGGPNAFNDALYHNNGDGTFTRVTRGSLVNDQGEGAGCAWGDYNRDGFLDLYVSNFQQQNPEKNGFYINSGNSNHWLVVKLEGRISNRSAIGAKVRIRAKIGGREFWQMREIASNGGYMSATTLEAYFGLGDAARVDAMRIEWPSGIVQELGPAEANQFMSIQEPLRVRVDSAPGNKIQISTEGRGEASLERTANFRDWEVVATRNDTNRVVQIDPLGELAYFRLR
jgi:hypothetical protein